MKYLLIVCIGLITSCNLLHAQKAHTLSSYTIGFSIKNTGLTVDGTFKGLETIIIFSVDKLSSSSINATIDASTINTGINARDNHLRKEEYFNVAKYPKIKMTSTSIKQTKTGFLGTFNITIKGITKQIDIPFTYHESEKGSIFKTTFILNRLDFKVGKDSWVMGDDVTVSITVNCING